MRRSQQDYHLGFKLAVASQVEQGAMTYKQAQWRYDLQGRSTVLVWLRKHGTLDWRSPAKQPVHAMGEETPAQKIERLERELSEERLKN